LNHWAGIEEVKTKLHVCMLSGLHVAKGCSHNLFNSGPMMQPHFLLLGQGIVAGDENRLRGEKTCSLYNVYMEL
jgi:hypothetical protein